MPAWQPTATLAAWQMRAKLLADIRRFFAERDVLEVDTPLLCQHTVSDPYVVPFTTTLHGQVDINSCKYLQTSPEYAMKRMLAYAPVSLYQICKAFRNEEAGQYHNPEFTLLEWYRVGFDLTALMDEMDLLLQLILKCLPAERMSYHALFAKHCELDLSTADSQQLQQYYLSQGLQVSDTLLQDPNRDLWLQLIMSDIVEPVIGLERPIFVYDFPASQAALAKLHDNAQGELVASRFEVYYQGIELANGYHELTDPNMQQQRFMQDNAKRAALGLSQVAHDQNLLAALQAGLPDCAGVAMGLDRVLMLKSGANDIAKTLTFTIKNA